MRATLRNPEVSAVQSNNGKYRSANLSDFDPNQLEQALRKLRADAKEARKLNPDLDAIPKAAFADVRRFWKAVHEPNGGAFGYVVRFPDIVPLDNGEIGLEWRHEQKILALSFNGDGYIVFAGRFGAESKVRGILTFSPPHLLAIIGMIASVYPCDSD